ncbi:hypothetical protein BZA70DRAFT_264787 [Myxozyma melibiosi]|uniref:Enoyl reductase (ER) domain-containing protein n=1 Tax=Myxozyma melibiosi TaxID=54550 RepID=A0ABR1FC43_9ASCO
MASIENKSVIFKSVPVGYPTADNLPVVSSTIPASAPEGGLLIKVLTISLDPYMRGRMRDASKKSYSPAFPLDQPTAGFGVSKVLDSAVAGFAKDDLVVSPVTNHAQYMAVPAALVGTFKKVTNPYNFPLSYFVGVLGMPGLTAYTSLEYVVGPLKAGETILVSAAAGAVGQIVGQIAKKRGLKVYGTVGSDEKVKYLTDKLGFDDAWNYKTETDCVAAINKHIPQGIDIFFDNVGGDLLDAVLVTANDFARIACCGQISQYNAKPEELYGYKNLMEIVTRRLKLQGFIVGDLVQQHPDVLGKFFAEVSGYLHDGSFVYQEDVVEGLENFADAFVGLLKGKNFGKLVIKVADE